MNVGVDITYWNWSREMSKGPYLVRTLRIKKKTKNTTLKSSRENTQVILQGNYPRNKWGSAILSEWGQSKIIFGQEIRSFTPNIPYEKLIF